MHPVVLIADSNELLRKGLSCWLARRRAVRRICEAGSVREALQAAARDTPDVAVIGMDLPEGSAGELVRKLSACPGRTRSIVVVKHGHGSTVDEAVRLDAAGLLGEHSPAAELGAAMDAVLSGRRYVSNVLTGRMLTFARLSARASGDLSDVLTRRERTVLRMIAEGDSNRRIAEQLGVSRRTIDTHRLRMMRKLGLRKTADIVRFAIRAGVVDV